MIFKYVFIISILFYSYSNGSFQNEFRDIEELLDTPLQTCLNCLCHARTGCWNRLTCASYSINQAYWRQAGSPTIMNRQAEETEAFRKCMGDENCILNTLKMYTESFGEIDCNSDGQFDCKDRFAIHIFGQNCQNPNYGKRFADRFNECAKDVGVDFMTEIEVPPQ